MFVDNSEVSEDKTVQEKGITSFEEFESSTQHIQFVPATEISTFLLDDKDRYVRDMSSSDLYARKVECQEAYRLTAYYSAIDFTTEQKDILTKACNEADAFFESYSNPNGSTGSGSGSGMFSQASSIKAIAYFDAKKAKELTWKLVLMKDNKYEEGLPHTRDMYIFITPTLLGGNQKDLIRTLIHEKIHIYQRKYRLEKSTITGEAEPVYLTDYMVEQLGYKKVKKRTDMTCDVRANPDVDEWIYSDPKTSGNMYLCYRSGKPTGITDVVGESINEHPYETIAYEIAKLYV